MTVPWEASAVAGAHAAVHRMGPEKVWAYQGLEEGKQHVTVGHSYPEVEHQKGLSFVAGRDPGLVVAVAVGLEEDADLLEVEVEVSAARSQGEAAEALYRSADQKEAKLGAACSARADSETEP